MEEVRKRRESNQARDRTRVSLRLAFTHWGELKETKWCKSDAELAFFLLDQSVITYPRHVLLSLVLHLLDVWLY